jgi:membrane-bound lytic murein transglycosylase F
MRPRLLVALLTTLLALGVPARAYAQSTVSDRLDDTFRKYAKRFFGPGVDWRLFKAQGMTESGLDPNATSRVGARGIMQLLPSTYEDVRSMTPAIGQKIDDPEWNIAAGILYDRTLWKVWPGALDDSHRWKFTFGSYNAGLVTVQRAQKVAEGRALDAWVWPSIELVAPQVRGWRHEETRAYVQRILAFVARMNANGRVVLKADPAPATPPLGPARVP